MAMAARVSKICERSVCHFPVNFLVVINRDFSYPNKPIDAPPLAPSVPSVLNLRHSHRSTSQPVNQMRKTTHTLTHAARITHVAGEGLVRTYPLIEERVSPM